MECGSSKVSKHNFLRLQTHIVEVLSASHPMQEQHLDPLYVSVNSIKSTRILRVSLECKTATTTSVLKLWLHLCFLFTHHRAAEVCHRQVH